MRYLVMLLVGIGAVAPVSAQYDPALDETVNIGTFYLDPFETESTTFEIAEQGHAVVGFSVAFYYDELPHQDSSWASDLLLTLTGPSGSSFTIGGDGAATDRLWDFQGAPSDPPGNYVQSPVLTDSVGNPAFNSNGAGGTTEGGTWTVYLTDDWFSTAGIQNVYSDVLITLHKAAGVATCRGDSDCDNSVTWRDIDYFVAAMNNDVQAWTNLFLPGAPACPYANNDVNADGTVNWHDIDPLVAAMNTACGG